jgi:uncharacterized protein
MSAPGFFQDKVVIITGASSGIGRAAALLFAGLHARVVLASRNMEKLELLRDEIRSRDGLAIAIEADTRNFEDTLKIARETISTWGRIDILIACAGSYVRDSSHRIDIRLFEESMSVNFFGTLNIIKSVLPEMEHQGTGHIVIVNSLDAKKGIVGMPLTCQPKQHWMDSAMYSARNKRKAISGLHRYTLAVWIHL